MSEPASDPEPHQAGVATSLRLVLAVALGLAITAAVVGMGVYGLRAHRPEAGDRDKTSGSAPATTRWVDAPLPELKLASAFSEQVGKRSYPPAQEPATRPELRWDFSSARTVTYDFEQTVASRTDFPGLDGSAPATQSQAVTGTLLARTRGDRTADLVFQDLKAAVKMDMGGGEPVTMNSAPPAMVIQGVREDGGLAVADSEMEALIKLLFPLPPRGLGVGESVDVPGAMPFNAGGSRLYAKGRTRLTLVGYVTIEGRRCAALDAEIDISSLDVPAELAGNYRLATKGRGRLYFDLQDRCFAAAELALIMSARAEMPMPDMALGGRRPPADLPKTQKMAMDSDNLIRVTRRSR